MKFKFDAKQQYQLDAINAVIDLFDGQTLKKGAFELSIAEPYNKMFESQVETHLGIGNHLEPDDDTINDNLRKIKKRNNIIHGADIKTKGKNFAIEMETGTGKTYVYLRTCFELNEKYGTVK